MGNKDNAMTNKSANLESLPDSNSKRKDVLQYLLEKATVFYEETIGILSGIFRISEFINTESPEDAFYEYVVRVLIEESRCENASIFALKDDNLFLRAATGDNGIKGNKGLVIGLGQGVAGRCVKEGNPILVNDVDLCEFFIKKAMQVEVGSMLCVPVKEGDNIIGVLNLSHSRPGFFSEHHVHMFELFGLLVGQILALVRIHDVLKKEYIDMESIIQQKDIALKDMSGKYKAIVDATGDFVFLFEDDKVVFSNKAFKGITDGYIEYLEDIFDSDSASVIKQHIAGLSPGQDLNLEVSVGMRDGSNREGEFFIKRLSPSQTLVIMRDITIKKHLEQKSMQTEKLTSLGLLTSGIAHELNNKLTPVLGFAELIDVSSLNPPDKRRLSAIVNSADAAKSIVESLLVFSKDLPPKRTIFDIREVIDRTITLYSPTIKKRNIKIITEIEPGPLVIRADMNCIEQVIVNLINNSIDAIGKGSGEITIRSFHDDDHIFVRVEDTGCGIPENVMSKVFDPFFTTKGQGKGTGLGLSICYGIIRDHEGDITLENTSNGTIAEVRLPASTGDISKGFLPGRVEYRVNRKDRKNREKYAYIMVIEDEENLLDLMSDALSPYYYVMGYKNGKEALDHINDHDWGLIISDLRMPEMDGMEFYGEALKSKPELKDIFVFITGDTYDLQVKAFFEQTDVAYIKKPFKIKEIMDVVQRYATDKRAEH